MFLLKRQIPQLQHVSNMAITFKFVAVMNDFSFEQFVISYNITQNCLNYILGRPPALLNSFLFTYV